MGWHEKGAREGLGLGSWLGLDMFLETRPLGIEPGSAYSG